MEIKTFTRVTHNEDKQIGLIRLPNKSDILDTVLLFLISRASVMGMFPFSTAMFAAVYDKKIAYLGIASMLLGLVSRGAGFSSIKYIFCGVIFWLYTRLREKDDNKILSSVVCGGSILACGGILLPYTNPSIYGIMLLISESILSAFLYIVFDKARLLVQGRENRTQIGHEELICLAVCGGGIIIGFSGVNLPTGIAVAHLLTMYAVMTISMHSSLGMASVGGIILGLVSSLDSQMAVICMGVYGLCAVFGNFLKTFGKAGVGLGFLGASAIALLYTGNAFDFPVKISEVIISVLAFILTPKKVHYMMGAFLSRSFHMEVIRADIRVKEYLVDKLEKVSASFAKLEECFFSVSERRLKMQTNEVCNMFDAVAEKVCESCGMSKQCWQKEFNDTYKQMFSILDVIEKKGYCDSANAPEFFKNKCVRLESFLVEFTHMYEIYKQKAVWVGEAVSGRDLVAKQYHEISNIMENLSKQINTGFSFLEDMENKVVEELDKKGFPVGEVSIIENGNGGLEVYLSVVFGTSIDDVCTEISSILDTPMEFVEIKNGVCRFISSGVYSVEIGTRQVSKDGQSVCGDSLVHFKTEDNKYCVILCDGMGSGKDAFKESDTTSKLLKQFLSAGFNRETAVEIINSTLALKMDKESFSTIDLLVIDLMTGIGEFLKIGGAESFIKKGAEIEAIFSKSLPVGMLGEVSFDAITRGFSDGEVIVMATDGITESGSGIIRGEWIKRAMSKSDDMDDLAQVIIDGAMEKGGAKVRDDMTVATVKVIRGKKSA